MSRNYKFLKPREGIRAAAGEFLIVVLFWSCNNQSAVSFNERNIMIDKDSFFQLYLPLTMLDTSEEGNYIFGSSDYVLMEHYGYLFFNSKNQKSKVRILYATEENEAYTEAVIDKLLAKEFRYIELDNMQTFISSDTLRVCGKKMGIVKKVEGCGDSALYTTSCFILSPCNNRIYRIHISCDQSEIGNMLRDSTSLILNSLYFKN